MSIHERIFVRSERNGSYRRHELGFKQTGNVGKDAEQLVKFYGLDPEPTPDKNAQSPQA